MIRVNVDDLACMGVTGYVSAPALERSPYRPDIAADLLGIAAGRVEPGTLADLILVEGDPTRDVTLLARPERVRWVMVGGRVHKAPAAAEGVPA